MCLLLLPNNRSDSITKCSLEHQRRGTVSGSTHFLRNQPGIERLESGDQVVVDWVSEGDFGGGCVASCQGKLYISTALMP